LNGTRISLLDIRSFEGPQDSEWVSGDHTDGMRWSRRIVVSWLSRTGMRADAGCRFEDIDNYRAAFRMLISEAARECLSKPQQASRTHHNLTYPATIDAVKDIK
jgi:hypothetical protein